MKNYKKFFVLMFLVMLAGAVASLISPFLLNLWASDGIGITGNRVLVLFLALVISMLVEVALIVLREKFAKHYNISNFKKYLGKFLEMNYDAVIETGTPKLIQRIQNAVNELYDFMTGSYISIWSNIFALVVIMFFVAQTNLMAGVIMLLMIPVNYFGYKLLNKKLAEKSKKLQEDSAKGYQQVLSFVEQTDYLKQCGSYENLFRQMEPAYELLYGSMADINVFAQSVSAVLRSVNRIAQTLSMAVIVWQVEPFGNDSVTLILVAILFPMFFSYLNGITNANLSKQGLNVSMEFIKEMESQREKSGEEVLKGVDTVEFSVDELHIGDRILAEHLTGKFGRGDVVWIRGASGAGKSTLAKLLVKFRDCGGIMFNGRDIRQFSNASVRERVNYLSQNVPVVEGTVRDNLSFNREWSREDEERLAAEPFFREFLKHHGMDSRVEEKGANLSGGEKQKLALARVLFDDVDVLVLDEFTSNIDKEAAVEIYETVVKNGKDKIIFIISHDDLPEQYATHSMYLDRR